MPKSKELKRVEARERQMLHLHRYRARVMDTLMDRTRASNALAEHKANDASASSAITPILERAFQAADESHKQAIKSLHRLCDELQCDTMGNPR